MSVMSDLEDELKRWDQGLMPMRMETLMEVARKVANPDLEAMARLLAGMNGFEFDDFDISYRQGWLTKAKALFDAAIGGISDG